MSEQNNNFDEKSPYEFEAAPRGAGRFQAVGLVAAGLVIAGGLVSGGAWAVTHTVDPTSDQQIAEVNSNDPLPGGFNDDLADDSDDSYIGALGPDLGGFAGDDAMDDSTDGSAPAGIDTPTDQNGSTGTTKPVPPISFGNGDDDDDDEDEDEDGDEDEDEDSEDEDDEDEYEDESDD